jgi:response regulator RpfG family c-di-GMP phosphodiesterase
MEARRERVLCVDDEPRVLDGLKRLMHHHFTVVTAPGGVEGLEILAADDPFAVVLSDMRMPGMDGAVFLREARKLKPDTVRILLTGQAELHAAISAVNEGNIFRFLTKPCAPDVLTASLQAAVEHYRLVTAERVLLEQTLHGSIKTLSDILALANPQAFGRATRVKQYVARVTDHLGTENRWQVEVAAMLSQIGCVTLPAETAEKLYHGRPLDAAEERMAERLPAVAARLLGNIPRLEPVREILVYQDKHFDGTGRPVDSVHGAQIPWGARLLKVVVDFDALETQAVPFDIALDTLCGRKGWYDPELLGALAAVLGGAGGSTVREMRLRDVRPGMTFAEDVLAKTGVLLIARGQEVTLGLLERIKNFSENIGVREPVRMIIGQVPEPPAPAQS